MGIQKIQHSDNNNKTGYCFAAGGVAAEIGHESYKTISTIKSEIDGFKSTLRYIRENSPFEDKATGIKVSYKDFAPEIKKMKEDRRTLIKEIKKTYPKRLLAKTIIGAIIGFILGKTISAFLQK